MRYIKIGVPDDFDESSLENTPLPVTVWEPPYIQLLDHGFIGLIDFMGEDSTITNAARVSYGKGTKKVNSDKGLIRYLMRHRHTTPFEMVEFTFHVKAPIFVFRQWHRHRTASINEYSGRYSVLEDEMYLPPIENAAPQSSSNRQGRDAETLTMNDYLAVTAAAEQVFYDSYATYKYLLGPKDENGSATPPDAINRRKLWVEECAVQAVKKIREDALKKDEPIRNEEAEEILEEKMREYYEANELSVTGEDFPGLARELARIVLPLATYSQMYWKANLKNILHFIGLRSDPHAQHEIRVYSDAMLELIKPIVPWAVEAFMDYQMQGANVSRSEMEVIKLLFATLAEEEETEGMTKEWVSATLRDSGASVREVNEFLSKIQ